MNVRERSDVKTKLVIHSFCLVPMSVSANRRRPSDPNDQIIPSNDLERARLAARAMRQLQSRACVKLGSFRLCIKDKDEKAKRERFHEYEYYFGDHGCSNNKNIPEDIHFESTWKCDPAQIDALYNAVRESL